MKWYFIGSVAWRALTVLLLFYVFWQGIYGPVPQLPILYESIRVLYFHVPMWFGMMLLLAIACVSAMRVLSGKNADKYDSMCLCYTQVGVVFGLLGLVTGMIWAKNTWGEAWSNDPKQNASALSLLFYLAYFVLRQALAQDKQQRARVSALYNVFCFAALIPLLFILPRLTDSLHPGSGGNPGFNTYDLDHHMRQVFYPAVIGWSLLGVWISQVWYKICRLNSSVAEDAEKTTLRHTD